jgi:hypothetical protein
MCRLSSRTQKKTVTASGLVTDLALFDFSGALDRYQPLRIIVEEADDDETNEDEVDNGRVQIHRFPVTVRYRCSNY